MKKNKLKIEDIIMSDVKTLILTIVRHGQTNANQEKLVHGIITNFSFFEKLSQEFFRFFILMKFNIFRKGKIFFSIS